MTKKILSIVSLIAVGMLFTACDHNSSKQGIPPADGAADKTTETTSHDDHAGHDHAGHDHAADEAHDGGEDMDAMASNGTDLQFEQGSWGWTLQDYIANGTGTQTFDLDQVSYEGDDLSVEGNKQLDDLAALLKANPEMKAEVRCHSREAKNAVGRTAKKTATGARAIWVKEKLKFRGVAGKQLSASGLADAELIEGVAGDDDSQNRITIALNK